MAGNGRKWQKVAGNGWNWTWFVPFLPLTLNTTGFGDDDDESNGMAYVTVLTDLIVKKIPHTGDKASLDRCG